MKESTRVHRTIEITADDLCEFLVYKGYNPTTDTKFEVVGSGQNYEEVRVSVGNGGHPDAAQPIIANWTEDGVPYGLVPYDPNFGDDKECICGHPYYRHFDTYDNMSPVGCKYCYGQCDQFELLTK